MTMLEEFVKERNEALFSLDRNKIEAYMKTVEFAKSKDPAGCMEKQIAEFLKDAEIVKEK